MPAWQEARVPVTYAGNISHYNRRHHQPFTQKYYRHNGYTTAWETDGIEVETVDGERATIYRFAWNNPRPETPVVRIVYIPREDAGTEVFVRRVIGVTE